MALDEHAGNAPLALARSRPIESQTRRAMRRFLCHRVAVTGLVILTIIALLAIFAPLVAGHSPTEINLRARNQGPSAAHWFGADRTGRDTFARTVYAGRISLTVGVAAVAISASIGALLGAVAGYFGGVVDSVVMRFTDVIMTFPAIVIILTAAAIVGPGLANTISIIGLLGWPTPCRLVRARFLSLRDQEFIQAARALGAPTPQIIVRHAFPNVLVVLIVYASLGIATAILLEAGLSFLGLGIQPPTPSWGNMLNVARDVDVLENQPWQWMPAGAAIVLTVLAVNFIGDGLRDALDPRAVT
ncbi:MAG TPA: oligopeptide ABC transporter permease [Thermomicrobiales bacterium]|nr:oligopeptide ABC transporter permease [Thermomicrobiales bacterium]